MSSLISYYPGNTLFHRLDPRIKIIFMLIACTGILMINNFFIAALVFGLIILLWFSAKLPFSVFLGFMKVLLPIAAFLFVIQAIFYPGATPLIKPLIPIGKGFGQITLEGIIYSFVLALRLMAMIIMLPLISYTTPVQDFALGMTKMGLPYTMAYTMTTALNLVPLLQTETKVIVDAQKLRAMQTFEKGKLGEKLRAYPALVTPLVIGSMRRAQLMAVAMDSRAFGASKKRTYLKDLKMRTADWLFMIATVVVTIGFIVLSRYL